MIYLWWYVPKNWKKLQKCMWCTNGIKLGSLRITTSIIRNWGSVNDSKNFSTEEVAPRWAANHVLLHVDYWDKQKIIKGDGQLKYEFFLGPSGTQRVWIDYFDHKVSSKSKNTPWSPSKLNFSTFGDILIGPKVSEESHFR